MHLSVCFHLVFLKTNLFKVKAPKRSMTMYNMKPSDLRDRARERGRAPQSAAQRAAGPRAGQRLAPSTSAQRPASGSWRAVGLGGRGREARAATQPSPKY